MRGKIIILRQNPGAHQLFRQNPDEIQQVLGLAVSDVIERVGRNGKAIRARFPLRRPAHDAEHALDDIVDVRKVALAVSVVENLNRLAGAELVGEAEIGHIRSAGGAVDGKKAQAGTGDVVKLGVGVRQKLVRFFGRGIERDGGVHLVLGRIRHLLVRAVNGGGRSIDQMFDRILPASFQNVVKTDDVAFYVHIGIRDGVPHTRLRGEIHDDLRPVAREEVGNQALVGKVSADEREVLERLELCQPRLLESDVIVVVQIVQPDYVRPRLVRQNALRQVRANKPGRAGNENICHNFPVLLIRATCLSLCNRLMIWSL